MDRHELLNKGQVALGCTAIVALVVFSVAIMRLPDTAKPASGHASKEFQWPALTMPTADLWSVIQRTGGSRIDTSSSLSKRFRLAGTFFAFGHGNVQTARRAIIDNLETGVQKLVKENDRIENVDIVGIFRDRVVLLSEGNEEELWIAFTETDKSDTSTVGTDSKASDAERTLSTSKFGRRVGENRWVLNRAKLMDYYQEMLDDPERLASIYLSLKPDRNEKRKIKGYYLGQEGEQDFFGAMGLKEGDVIRKVNSMKMTSQARAEYFLGEFVNQRLNALVLEVEREGNQEKLVYLIR